MVSLVRLLVRSSAECGDYVAEDYPDHTYLASYKFVPTQDAELERRIMENHKKHVYALPSQPFFFFQSQPTRFLFFFIQE